MQKFKLKACALFHHFKSVPGKQNSANTRWMHFSVNEIRRQFEKGERGAECVRQTNMPQYAGLALLGSGS